MGVGGKKVFSTGYYNRPFASFVPIIPIGQLRKGRSISLGSFMTGVQIWVGDIEWLKYSLYVLRGSIGFVEAE